MPDDYSADRFTTGTVAVGDTATGNIGSNGDGDWFAVELVAGRTYVIDLRGSPTDDGTLSDPYLRGVYDADGNLIPRTTNDDGGEGYNSRLTFTATESGTHYIAAGAAGVYFGRGTYEVEVTDTSPPIVAPDPDSEEPPDTQEQVQQQPPAFGSQFYGFELPEDTDGSANRISLGTVSATDPDGGSVTYSIEGGNAAGLFEIDAASGELFYTGGGEDYETGSTSFELTVRASDGDQTTDTTVAVNVTDVAEAPAFGQAGYGFDLAEDTDGSADRISLGTVSATDPDGGSVTYSIEGGNAARLFEIDAASGELFYTGGGEDYETGSTSFELTVRASDGDQTTDTTATVSVTDVDEPVEVDPPVVQPDPARAAAEDLGDITELAAPLSPLGTLDGAADGVAWYRFTLSEAREVALGLRRQDADADLVVEDAAGNVLHSGANDGTANEWVRETLLAGTYYVSVEAQEAGANAYVFRYGVGDADPAEVARLEAERTSAQEQEQEQVQQQPPAFGSQFYGFDLPEDTDGSANRISLGTVSATDPDGGSVTYSIEGGNAAGLFEIDAASGELFYTGGGEDYETGSTSFELTVRASDGDQTTDTTATVSVTDVDEPVEVDPPVAQPDQSTPQTVSEPAGEDFSAGTSTSGRVAVGDTATGNIGGSRDGDWFAVELVAGRTYVIDLRGSPTGDGTLSDPYLRGIHDSDGNLIPRTTNDDGGQNYNSRVTFTATESGTHYIAAGSYFGRGTYEVEVTDTSPPIVAPDPDPEDSPDTQEQVQQQPPAFGSQFYGFELPEDTDGSVNRISLGTVSATDPDGGSVTYSIEGGNAAGLFEIDAASGELFYTGGGEDYETGSTSFELTVRASDGDQTTDTTVAVNVTDVDDPVEVDPPVAQPDQSTPQTVSEPAGEDFSAGTSTSGRVAVGDSVTGNIGSNGDRDWFAVELVAGRTYVIDLRGRPTGDRTLSDPYLHGIHDSDGDLIPRTTNDDGGGGYNSRVTFTATESGTHYIAAGANSNSLGTYELEVTHTTIDDDFPATVDTTGTAEVGGSATGELQYAGDRDWFAVELEAGKTYQIDVAGAISGGGTLPSGRLYGVYDADGNRLHWVYDAITIGGFALGPYPVEHYEDAQVFFTPYEDGTYYLAVGDRGTGTYSVRVTEIEDDFPATVDTTGTVEVGGTATGELQYETDRDWFAVDLTAGETYKVELLGGRGKGGTLQDPYIRGIHDGDGRSIYGTTDYASGPHSNSEVLFTPDEDGTYYIAAGSFMSGDREEDVGTYTLQVSIDDFRDDVDTTGTVEVGGSVAGEIEGQGDHDWFAVTLEAGKTYQIDMKGSETDGGTLENPFLRTMRDANGDYVRNANGYVNWNTSNWDSGEGLNARVTFTPDEDATYYVVAASGGPGGGPQPAADSHGRSLGTYTLSVEESVPPVEDLVDAI